MKYIILVLLCLTISACAPAREQWQDMKNDMQRIVNP